MKLSYKTKIKSIASKLNFVLGNNPVIEKNDNFRKYIPEPYQAVVTITADFELAWAWRYSKAFENNKDKILTLAQRERENIPKILKLCEKYNIPVTWATVGHLFLKSCSKINGLAHPELKRLTYFENKYSKFSKGDWFDDDPCTNYKDAPEWYAPDLIDMICKSKVEHEIGCHTFSHIDCRDEVCHPNIFESEINACKLEAAKLGLNLQSFVHPGHQIGNLDRLAELGLTSFQTDPGNILGYPVKHSNGLWELKRTYGFSYRKEWSVDYHIYRYKKIVDRAVNSNTVCNFWFHPSLNFRFINEVLPFLLEYIEEYREIIYTSSINEYICLLNFQNE